MKYQSEIHNYITENRNEIIETLKMLARIPSVRGEEKKGMPFGERCYEMLCKTEELYRQNGFETEMDNGGKYLLSFYGSGDKSVGIFAHSDVVAVGDDWIFTSPFEPIEKDGFLIGRGLLDDKAAVVISLYTAKMLKELNIPFNSRLVMFTGAGEETGMDDVAAYADSHNPPDFSLVADAAFPCFRGDKGRVNFTAAATDSLNEIVEFCGGVAGGGSVVGNAYAKVKYSESLYSELKSAENERLKISANSEFAEITAVGIPKHSALPEGSLNAVFLIADALSKCQSLCENDRRQMKFISDITREYYGKSLGIENLDSDFGHLTCVNRYACLSGGKVSLDFNIRHGLAITPEKIETTVKAKLSDNGFIMNDFSSAVPFCIPKDNKFLVEVLNTYREFTGDKNAVSYINAGGTYAYWLPNAVETGPQFWKDVPFSVPAGHGGVHQPDEMLSIDGFLEAMELTALMILRCGGLMNTGGEV